MRPYVLQKLADFNRNDETTMSNEVSQDVTNTIEVAEMDQRIETGGYKISYKEPGIFDATPTHLVRIIDIYADDYTEPTLVSGDVFEDILDNSTFINNRLSNFAYFSAKLRITVVVNGSPTVAGRFLLAFQPWVRYPNARIAMGNGDNDITIPQAYTMPHIEIDPSVSKTYTLDLPTPTVTGTFNKDQAIEGLRRQESYRAWWVPIVPPIGGTATTPDVSNTIYFSFASIEPGAIHNSGVADMELNDKREEEESPKLSSMLTTASNMADKASSFPVIGTYASTFSSIAKNAAGALNMFGYSKPTDEKLDPFVQIRDIANMSHVDSGFEGFTLSSNAKNSVAIGDVMGFGKEDDMSIPSLCKKKTYVGKFSIASTASPQTYLTGYRVTPALCPATITGSQTELDLTPMAHMTSMFQYWHGTIDFEFEIVCTAYHRCTLLFAWSPYFSTTPTFDEALNVLNNTNVTVSGNTIVNMSIPWRRPFPWLPTCGPTKPYGSQSIEESNGTIWIYVVNPVTSNGSTDAIEVIVKTKSDDLALALPTLRYYNAIDPNDNALVTYKGITPDPPAAAKVREEAPVHNSVVEENNPNPMFGDSFGENAALSTKALSQKLSYVTTLSFNSKGAITVPNSPLWPSDIGIPIWTRTDPAQYWTFQSVCAIGYLGCRGSTNVGLLSQKATQTGAPANAQRVWASIGGPRASANGALSLTLGIERAWKYGTNAFTQQEMGVNANNLFFTVPHNLQYPMRILNRQTQFNNSDQYGDYYVVGFDSKGLNQEDPGSVALCTAAGDDFSFIWYICPTKTVFFKTDG